MAADTYYKLLYELLGTAPSVILRRGPTPDGDIGTVQHTNKIITINESVAAPDFAGALIKATVDLHRGSALAPERLQEAERVRAEAARIAVHPVLALMHDDVDAARLARALGVDVATVLLGIRLAAGTDGTTMR